MLELARATHGLISILPVALGFTGGRYVLCSGLLQDFLGSLDPLGIVTVHGEKDSSLFDSAFVAFCFILGNAHANQGSSYAADYSAGAGTSERGHDWTSGNQRADSGNRQRTDSGQPPQASADYRTRSCSSGGSLWRLGAFLVGEILGSLVLRKQNRDVGVPKIFLAQPVDCIFDADPGTINSKYCRIFACHADLLYVLIIGCSRSYWVKPSYRPRKLQSHS